MAKKEADHLHKYERVILGSSRVIKKDGRKFIEKTSGYLVFRCRVPGCPHYLAREVVLGREGQCWKCGKRLIMDEENTRLKHPTHPECRRIRVSNKEVNAA